MSAETFDWSWLHAASRAPEVTLDVWLALPEELCSTIEVEDGRVVHCDSASPEHQAVQHNLQEALRDATSKADAENGTCHRVRGDIDVLLTEVPFHYRKPDVIVYRCLPPERKTARWRKPLASDVLIAVEVVSHTTVTEDLRTKRAVYAAAGIPHYWSVRMAGDDGLAVSVERLSLTADGSYATEGVAFRDRHLNAVDTMNPFHIPIPWERLDLDL